MIFDFKANICSHFLDCQRTDVIEYLRNVFSNQSLEITLESQIIPNDVFDN